MNPIIYMIQAVFPVRVTRSISESSMERQENKYGGHGRSLMNVCFLTMATVEEVSTAVKIW